MKCFQLFSCTVLAAVLVLNGCTAPLPLTSNQDLSRYQPQPYIKFEHQDWTKNASIYQINTRQFTQEGTFRAAAKELPSVKALGTDIIWLMPIHPIGEQNRKGELGSPYAVKDYFAVNPEFGTLTDFKYFVDEAHQLGMYVIIDWVANHTAWDNVIRQEHPEWYAKDYKGDVHPTPWFDWFDIIDLDYRSPELRQYMSSALKYWVKEVGIDGYRCDAAGFVPLDFWNNVSAELRQIKPVFMLAEWESRDMHEHAFDASYAWSWWEIMHDLAKGKASLGELAGYYAWNEKFYPKDSYRMTFVTNHDKNSWDGTDRELFGEALESVAVLSVIGEGMPLIYNGQEAGNNKRLEFFKRDPIQWKKDPMGELYRRLFALKKDNTALWNGHWGATMIKVPNSIPDKVFSFVRQNDKDKVFGVFNFSDTPVTVDFDEQLFTGQYQDFSSGNTVKFEANSTLDIEPWGYRVLLQ